MTFLYKTFQSTTMTKQKKIITRIVSGAWISLLLCFFFRYDISFTIIPQYVHFQCNNIVNFFQKCLISPHQNFFLTNRMKLYFHSNRETIKEVFQSGGSRVLEPKKILLATEVGLNYKKCPIFLLTNIVRDLFRINSLSFK